ncbi:hypothetical protein FB451DRAFT_70951 [Mycena latifolia]|nr:hypothetical protein FB451DRAFT_70951 [Mycena latifolia]
MLRRSTRKKAEEDHDNSVIPQTEPRASNKRPKKGPADVDESKVPKPDAKPKPERKRGKLRFITEMPLDILFEIFGQLYPADLLNISRSSKALRNIILRKSVAFIWKQAFLNFTDGPPPPCPDDLNEVQYANLLWGKHCFFCGVFTTLVVWQCRIRTCKGCIQTSNFTLLGRYAGLRDTAQEVCPKWHHSNSVGYICVTSDLEAIRKQLNELDETKTDTREFIQNSQQISRAKTQHANLCRSWEHLQKLRRRIEHKDVRETRKIAILGKLEKLGWSDELYRGATMSALLTLPAFKQNKELTERMWTNMEPELITFLAETKRRRLEDERIRVLRSRISVLATAAEQHLSIMPISEPRPSISDLCAMPEYRAILESPSGTKITKDDFAELLTHLSDQTDRWQKSNIEILLRLLPSFKSSSKQRGKKGSDAAPLDLCTIFFRCHSCQEPIPYPRILSHACLLNESAKDEEEHTEEKGDLLYRACYHLPWIQSQKGIAFDTEASNITTMLVKLCRQDSKTLTSAMMEELEPRFECLRCPHPRQGRLVMQWRIALLHELEEHYGETVTPKSWKILNAEDVIAAKEQEAKTRKQPPPHLLCLKCNDGEKRFTRRQIQEHLVSQHATDSFEDNVMRHPDTTIRMPPAAVRLMINDGQKLLV